jgi:hypothetical protein
LLVADWSVVRFCASQSVSLASGGFRRQTHLVHLVWFFSSSAGFSFAGHGL